MKWIREFTITLLPLCLIILIDQSTKQWASQLADIKTTDLLTFQYQLNQGLFLGSLAELAPTTKNIVLTTVTLLIICAYLISIFLVPIKSWIFKLSISLIVGGILSNTIDRFFTNYVIDFIQIEIGQNTLFFNLSDLFQILAYAALSIFIFIK